MRTKLKIKTICCAVCTFSTLINSNGSTSSDSMLFPNEEQPIGENEFDESNTVCLIEYVLGANILIEN